jgi:pimeloyl-ACP methyl ester carboxylesterase
MAAEPTPTLRAQEFLLRSQWRNMPASDSLSFALGAAKAAFPGMLAGNPRDVQTYAAALRRIVPALRTNNFADRTVSGPGGTFLVNVECRGQHLLDPSAASSITPAADVRLIGAARRITVEGAGVPYVFFYEQGSAFLANQPGISRAGLSIAVTAFLSFDAEGAHLSFVDRLDEKHVRWNGKKLTLAADFSAPISQTIARTPNRPFDIPGLIFTRQHMPSAGLYQFDLYDPKKVPVVLVHGLFSRPEVWAQVLNELMADPRIRARYQFWFFLYPTGLPIWKSSMLLRADLDRFHETLERNGRVPDLHRIILVGHSMGGLVSSLMVREPGKSFWAAISDKSLDDLDLSPEGKKMLREMVQFQPRRDISRVIYVTTPHRGSPIPHSRVIQQAIRMIQMPQTFSRSDRRVIVDAIREDVRALFVLPANSIRFLKSGSPVLEALETLPMSDHIPYHSIIGDRGKGDSPDSTDGVVPYWSSHMDSAVSEKIIPTDHSAPNYPETAGEIRRILLKAAGY